MRSPGSGLLVALLASAAGAPRIELPPGPAADAASRIDAETRAAALPALPQDAWGSPATWKRFSELLSAEAAAAAPDPSRRAELALLALEQHRWEDAWSRFAECAASPPTLAALLPHFLPGVPGNAALPDGAVLRPALPPQTTGAAEIPRGAVQRRAMRIEGLVVGAATLAVRVSVEGEGVEIDVEHLSGGGAELLVAIPEEPQYAFADEYVDWFKQEEGGVPHKVSVHPGDEPHTLYARFERRPPQWPTLLPDRLPAQIESGTTWLDAGADATARPLLEAVAQSLASGPLHVAARVRDPKKSLEGDLGVRIDLSDAATRPRKLAWIAGAVESRALRAPR